MLGLALGVWAVLGGAGTIGEEGVRQGLEAKLGGVEYQQRRLEGVQHEAEQNRRYWQHMQEQTLGALGQEGGEARRRAEACTVYRNRMGHLTTQGAMALRAGQGLGAWALARKRLGLMLRRCEEEAQRLLERRQWLAWQQRRLLRMGEGLQEAQARREVWAQELHRQAMAWTDALTGGRLRAGRGEDIGALKGRLYPPVYGYVEMPYGASLNPKSNTLTPHKGIRIRAAKGSRVRAIAAGKVVYIGELKGFGRLLIIEHRGGYHSLSAHLGEVYPEEGEALAAGDWIGTLGGGEASGAGASLYFEIRRGGEAEDPKAWFVHSSFR